jgi:hypothetical protein
MDSKNVLAKKRLMQNVENKTHELTWEISSFKKIFNDVFKHDLPSFLDGNGDM